MILGTYFQMTPGVKSTHIHPHINNGRKQTRPKVNNQQTQENGTYLSTVLVCNFSACLQVFKIKFGGKKYYSKSMKTTEKGT